MGHHHVCARSRARARHTQHSADLDVLNPRARAHARKREPVDFVIRRDDGAPIPDAHVAQDTRVVVGISPTIWHAHEAFDHGVDGGRGRIPGDHHPAPLAHPAPRDGHVGRRVCHLRGF
eukprot:5079275-Prymnesium_polylepis.2